jgi:hypothetical protein
MSGAAPVMIRGPNSAFQDFSLYAPVYHGLIPLICAILKIYLFCNSGEYWMRHGNADFELYVGKFQAPPTVLKRTINEKLIFQDLSTS